MGAKLFPQNQYPVRWIPVSECEVVYADAQRGINDRNVKRIAEQFNPDMFGVITVSNKNGVDRYHVIDGQHRIAALKLMGYTDQMVPAIVREVHTAREAADMFDGINSALKPQALDRFKVRVTAGYEEEVAVDALVRSLGLRIGYDAGNPNVVAAVNALMAVYRQHGLPVLRGALETIKATWKQDNTAMSGSIIQGYGELLGRHAHEIDNRRLVAVVAKKHNAANLIAAAKTSKSMFGGRMFENVARAVVAVYNSGIRGSGRITFE